MQRVIREGMDRDGWNIKGEIYAGTWGRVDLELHKVKEEILELALGVDVKVGWEMIRWVLIYFSFFFPFLLFVCLGKRKTRLPQFIQDDELVDSLLSQRNAHIWWLEYIPNNNPPAVWR